MQQERPARQQKSGVAGFANPIWLSEDGSKEGLWIEPRLNTNTIARNTPIRRVFDMILSPLM
jgi:hypothetical protein